MKTYYTINTVEGTECDFCKAAKSLLEQEGIKHLYVKRPKEWFSQRGYKTQPQIYKEGIPIGGYEDLKKDLLGS